MIIAQCPVCQELLECNTDLHLSVLQCGHVFHWACIDTWLKTSLTCPQCRLKVTRRQMVERIFFSVIDQASTSILLPDIPGSPSVKEPSAKESELFNRADVNSVTLALHKSKSELTRMGNQVAALKDEKKTLERQLSAKCKELEAVTCLYTEVDKLYSAGNQKYKQLRLELSGYKQFLQEAEAIKSEGMELRRQMSEMKNLQTIIGNSETAVKELFLRYNDSSSTNPSPNSLRNLCQWAAVLRTELSSARAKIRQYRIQMHRLQKTQTSATQRMLTAEADATECKEQVEHLKKELATVLKVNMANSNLSRPTSPSSSSNIPKNKRASTEDENHALHDNLGIRSCLRLVDVNTPDLSPLSWSHDLKLTKEATVTPCVNPFKINDCSPTTTPASRQSTVIENADDYEQLNKNANVRRPSSLYQLSLMRNYASSKVNLTSSPYNGFGGQESQIGPSSLYFQEQKPTTSACTESAKRSKQTKPNIIKKFNKLDAFLRKNYA